MRERTEIELPKEAGKYDKINLAWSEKVGDDPAFVEIEATSLGIGIGLYLEGDPAVKFIDSFKVDT